MSNITVIDICADAVLDLPDRKEERMSAGLIDIHSHILPGIDDGAADWAETRQMLTMAYEQGIHTIIATPHFLGKQNVNQLRDLTKQLSAEAKKVFPGFQIYLGQELMYFDSLVEYLKRGDALTLADTRYILVEFQPDVTYQNLYQGVRKLLMSGYLPVLAHAERYQALRKDGRIEELLAAGGYLQMNYSSIDGGFFHSQARWCREQLLNNCIHFLGTDMHHHHQRTPVINKSLKWLARNLGSEQALLLTKANAVSLLENRVL